MFGRDGWLADNYAQIRGGFALSAQAILGAYRLI